MPRSSIAWVMVAVSLAGLGLAAFRAANPLLGEIIFCSSYALLVVATVAAAVRGRRSPHWIGFAIFGWASLLADSGLVGQTAPIASLCGEVVWRTAPRPTPPAGYTIHQAGERRPRIVYSAPPDDPRTPPRFQAAVDAYNANGEAAVAIGQALLSLVFGCFGACVARLLAPRDAPSTRSDPRLPL